MLKGLFGRSKRGPSEQDAFEARMEQYQRQLKALGMPEKGDTMEFSAVSLAETKAELKRIRDIRKILKQQKRDVNHRVKSLNAEYKKELSKTRRNSRRWKQLAQTLNEGLAYFENFKLSIDHLLIQLNAFELQLQQYLETLQQSKTPVSNREPIQRDTQREVWRRDEGRCVVCGSQENLEFDHIIPISKGGANTARNIQLLCEACNRSKGARVGGP